MSFFAQRACGSGVLTTGPISSGLVVRDGDAAAAEVSGVTPRDGVSESIGDRNPDRPRTQPRRLNVAVGKLCGASDGRMCLTT